MTLKSKLLSSEIFSSRRPEPVAGGIVMVVAGIGILVNTATALLFMSGRKGDLNIRGTFMHMAADAVVSAGVVAAGFAISVTGLLWLDPAVSLAIVVVLGVRPKLEDDDAVLVQLDRELHDDFGIEHPTIQIERGHGPHGCKLASAAVV